MRARIVNNVVAEIIKSGHAKFHPKLEFVEVDDSVQVGMIYDQKAKRFIDGHNKVPSIHSHEHLQNYVKGLSQRARFKGTVTVDSNNYGTDPELKIDLLIQLADLLNDDTGKVVNYQLLDGTIVQHDLNKVQSIIAAMNDHMSSALELERIALARIKANKITNEDQVDGHFEPVIARNFARPAKKGTP